MKYITLLALSLTILWSASAQETVVWAAEVIDVSSEFSRYEYTAVQALQRPNVLPRGGEDPNAWRPKNTSKDEFIMVAFDQPIRAQQIAIAESENPGAVKAVYGYDTNYNEYLLFELTPRTLPIESRLLNLFFEETPYELQAVMVVLDGKAVPGYNAIDAIGVSDSNIPIHVLLNLVKGINTNIEVDQLGKEVNSGFVEQSPIVSPDGKRLYFSRQFHPGNVGGIKDQEDIWVSELDEETGKWKEATNVGPPLNNKGPNFISSISIVDGEEVFILGNRYKRRNRMLSGVSMSIRKKDSTFTKPVSIDIENEYNYSYNADFFLVSGGKAMLISAERDDTFGWRDLYVTFKRDFGNSWTEPLNLGSDINTIGEDESPFLAKDGRTLYFSSNGYQGYGGADIFVCYRLDDTWTRWSTPENLGAGINKSGDDEYFHIPNVGKHLYFTREGDDENADIFRFSANDLFVSENELIATVEHLLDEPEEELVEVEQPEEVVVKEAIEENVVPEVFVRIIGRVLDARTQNPVSNARVLIERLPDGAEVGSVRADSATGIYELAVRPGARYGIAGEAEGYLSESANFDFNNITVSDTILQDLRIFPIERGESIVLNNIFFDVNRWELKTGSFPELRRVMRYLTENQVENIEISGHTDSVGDDAYNMELSRKRAQSVMDFFIRNGVPPAKLTLKAYGETRPLLPNDTPESRRRNRRVEFKIL